MILLNTALFAVVCAAALWPRETLKQLVILDYSIRLFWIDCQIAWVTFWLIMKSSPRRHGCSSLLGQPVAGKGNSGGS